MVSENSHDKILKRFIMTSSYTICVH